MNKQQTKVPEAVEEVLDAVAEHMGILEAKPSDVSPYVDYGDLLVRALGNLRDVHATYTLVQSEGWKEIQRLQQEEKERLEAQRWERSRDNILVGILSSLTMKFRKSLPDSEIGFTIDGDGALVTVAAPTTFIEVEYDALNRILYTVIDEATFEENVTKVDGNQAPTAQFKGLAAIYEFLAELEKEEN